MVRAKIVMESSAALRIEIHPFYFDVVSFAYKISFKQKKLYTLKMSIFRLFGIQVLYLHQSFIGHGESQNPHGKFCSSQN